MITPFLMTGPSLLDVTTQVGLGPEIVTETVARICFADLNNDGFPDLVVDRHRVFLNVPDPKSSVGRRFQEVPKAKTGLLEPVERTVVVFPDLDDDGKLDALTTEYINAGVRDWKDHGRRSRWQKGKGDGTFQEPTPLPLPARPSISVAVGDVNLDGKLDIFVANSYKAGIEGYPGDLLTSTMNGSWVQTCLPAEAIPFNDVTDPGGRPSFGAMIANLEGKPSIFSLSYGRRWNRLWTQRSPGAWEDLAPQLGLDGDDNRSGIYPDWLKEIAKTDKRYPQADEICVALYQMNGSWHKMSV